ncbi:MAG: hypothetical protein BWY89_00298 [Bacteroidetes bacterium ADurb.BinA012]|nr:MAG: hypothetical protein BWY89_00298 [Bacteroidetes bacterium ADurb.BinA012]
MLHPGQVILVNRLLKHHRINTMIHHLIDEAKRCFRRITLVGIYQNPAIRCAIPYGQHPFNILLQVDAHLCLYHPESLGSQLYGLLLCLFGRHDGDGEVSLNPVVCSTKEPVERDLQALCVCIKQGHFNGTPCGRLCPERTLQCVCN